MNNVFILIALLVFFFFLLVKSTGWLMEALKGILRSTRATSYGLAAFVLALATSLPELVVAISAGMRGASELSLGNVLGSNIANLSIVVGGAAIVAYQLRASDHFLKTEVFYVFLVGALPLLLLMDGQLTRPDGLVLLVVYVGYVIWQLKKKRMQEVAEEIAYEPLWRRILVTLHKPRMERSVLHLLLAIGILAVSADMIVRSSLTLSTILQIPELVVGIFVIGLGTVMPELMTGIAAVRRREVAMVFGNILGSVAANSTLILGMAVVLSPVTEISMWSYGVAVTAFVLVYFLFWYFVWTKHRLDRWEGGALVTAYLLFLLLELFRGK